MTPAALIAAVREASGLPMLSDRVCLEIAKGVLLAVREPAPNVTVRGWNHVNAALEGGSQAEMNKLYVTFIDALVSELGGEG